MSEQNTHASNAAELGQDMQGTAQSEQLLGSEAADSLRGGDGDDSIWGENGDDSLYGDAGNDLMSGANGNDKLWGGDGDDQLWAEWGNDTLDGGAGNDYLRGGDGADVYKFGKGSGQDSIDNSGWDALGDQPDSIELGAGITQADVSLLRQNTDLLIQLNGTEDSLRVLNYFDANASTSNAIEQINFADGSNWSIADVKSEVSAAETALGSQLDALVSAMAAFAPPAAGQSSLSADYQSTLTSIIAVS